jgi:hypothetical protein
LFPPRKGIARTIYVTEVQYRANTAFEALFGSFLAPSGKGMGMPTAITILALVVASSIPHAVTLS